MFLCVCGVRAHALPVINTCRCEQTLTKLQCRERQEQLQTQKATKQQARDELYEKVTTLLIITVIIIMSATIHH